MPVRARGRRLDVKTCVRAEQRPAGRAGREGGRRRGGLVVPVQRGRAGARRRRGARAARGGAAARAAVLRAPRRDTAPPAAGRGDGRARHPRQRRAGRRPRQPARVPGGRRCRRRRGAVRQGVPEVAEDNGYERADAAQLQCWG
jgi:hypothetical protein